MTGTLTAARALRVALAGAGVLLLAACAVPVRDPWGQRIVAQAGRDLSSMHPLPSPPARLQVDLGVEPAQPGSLPFTARLYAEPGHRYRLDAYGFVPAIVASWQWEGMGEDRVDTVGEGGGRSVRGAGDGMWVFVRHDRREVRRGTGATLRVDGMPAALPDVHAALGFLWGHPVPGFPAVAPPVDPAGRVRWQRDGATWTADFDPATGLCRAVEGPGFRILYARHARRGDRVIPGEARLFVDGARVLTLHVRAWNANPVWPKDPFNLRVPETYGE